MQLPANVFENALHHLGSGHSGSLDLTARASKYERVPLHPIQKRADPFIITVALLSGIAILASLSFLTWRLVFWKRYSTVYLGYNQHVILIFNLIIADMFTASAALITAHWHKLGAIHGVSNTCVAQGFLFQIGDPSIGLFVLAIATHTFMTVVLGRKLEYRTFVACIIGLWVFCLLLALIPFMVGGKHIYTYAGAWCWIDGKYENLRLWTHYMWIFISQFGCVVLYTILFFYLRRQIALSATLTQPSREKLLRLKRVVTLMVLYPIAYIFLSMPIAAGRMAVASGVTPPFIYVICAGCIMATSGIVHAIIYTITRKSLILSSNSASSRNHDHASVTKEAYGLRTEEESNIGTPTTCTFTVGSPPPPHFKPMGTYKKLCCHISNFLPLGRGGRSPSSSGTSATLELKETGVYQQTTILVSHEPVGLKPHSRDDAWSTNTDPSLSRPTSSRIWPRKY